MSKINEGWRGQILPIQKWHGVSQKLVIEARKKRQWILDLPWTGGEKRDSGCNPNQLNMKLDLEMTFCVVYLYKWSWIFEMAIS